MKISKFELILLLGMGFCVGVLATTSFMYLVPDSPLMVREKAFNDTADDLIELADKYDSLACKTGHSDCLK